MEESILNTIKKILGLGDGYTAFDIDIITHINSIFPILSQLGIGPTDGFYIEDDTYIWADFIGEDRTLYNLVKSYMALRVRMLFDPPTTSFTIEAMNKQIQEFEWRITTIRDSVIAAEEV